ncbi:hypothetical protein [Flavobacterium limnophilum]|uniref:hypothetical protein n=1 Tax=Flavobacterium limnophilum TaxID=3003262 RepID=UPI0022ABCEB4|nr:hypothetical protein [Flavobacterium limnophilum]
MERNNIETQFREQLNSREIKPSDMAWDKLDAMLTAEEKKSKNKFSWIYIAASFVGFLLVVTLYFTQKENKIDIKKNAVVIENSIPKENSKTEIKSIKSEPNFSKTILKSETKPLVQTQKSTKSKVENSTLKNQETIVTQIQYNNQNLAIAEHKNISPENIDSLMASVEKNQKSGVKNPSVKIHSKDLLNQVDGELQLSFREKALNTITRKYKEAREALANRNNQ